MAAEFSLYMGFLIVREASMEYSAYRSPQYYAEKIPSYTGAAQLYIHQSIDRAADSGEFTEDSYAELVGQERLGAPKGNGNGAGGQVTCPGCSKVLDKVVVSFAVLGWDESALEYLKVEDTGDFACPYCGEVLAETEFRPPE